MAADVLARFHRLRGERVLFATGTDENAPKVVQAAEAGGMEPGPFVDGMAANFQRAWAELNVKYDVFIRTTEERHRRAVQAFFNTLQERGDIYKGPYEGWYCISCETFFAEEEAPEVQRGAALPQRAPPPAAAAGAGDELLLRAFPLRRAAPAAHRGAPGVPPAGVPPERGPPVHQPGPAGRVHHPLVGRMGHPRARRPVAGGVRLVRRADQLHHPRGLSRRPGEMARWWPADVHLVGKDIYVRFHCTLWPAMLMAAGLDLPRTVFGHGFWMSEGRKMSKTLGNVIEPLRLAGWLAELSGAPLRDRRGRHPLLPLPGDAVR